MLFVALAALFATVLSAGIHYQLFNLLATRLPRVRFVQRQRVTIGILGAIGAHLLEIAVFAGAMAALDALPAAWNVGQLQSTEAHSWADYLYWSAVCYTTMGFEHVTPVGGIRLLVGVEALTGLVLVAWTASFTYFQMEKFWSERRGGTSTSATCRDSRKASSRINAASSAGAALNASPRPFTSRLDGSLMPGLGRPACLGVTAEATATGRVSG